VCARACPHHHVSFLHKWKHNVHSFPFIAFYDNISSIGLQISYLRWRMVCVDFLHLWCFCNGHPWIYHLCPHQQVNLFNKLLELVLLRKVVGATYTFWMMEMNWPLMRLCQLSFLPRIYKGVNLPISLLIIYDQVFWSLKLWVIGKMLSGVSFLIWISLWSWSLFHL
jgi:hypothetical protein